MEAYNLAHKLAYAGRRSPVPFTTSPEYTNSVPGVPVLAMLRLFLEREDWSHENVKTVAREVARVLGSSEQYDIGITLGEPEYRANKPAAGAIARMMKLDPREPFIMLRITDDEGDRVYRARYPRLNFEPYGEDFWQASAAPGTVSTPSSK